MFTVNKITTLASAVALVFAAAGSVAHANNSYAESIYAEYADSAKGAVSFDLIVAGEGPLSMLAGKRFGELMAVPGRVLKANDDGFSTKQHAFESIHAKSAELADLNGTIDGFAKIGFPVETGRYRFLEVVMTVGNDISTHQSIEFCWKQQAHCVLLDPSVEFIDSIANNRIGFRAAGLAPTIETESTGGAKAACGLASNPSTKSRTTTYPARNIKYKNVFKKTLVNKDLGGQQSGVRCDTSCKAQPFGYSNSSSAQGYLGWRTDCDHTFASGKSSNGQTAKFTGLTACAHRYAVAADVSMNVNGSGAGVSINVDVGGSLDSTGGFVVESCGIF